MACWIALLRAVNVGGAGKLPMKDLVAIFAGCGCNDVETYIQSGNVVFLASEGAAAALPGRVSAALREQFDIEAPVILRREREWRRIVDDNPFVARGVDSDELHVMFLGAPTLPGAGRPLSPAHSAPDEFAVKDNDIYLRLPNGVGRSKLTNAYFERALGAPATARNWRTVLRLGDMARNKNVAWANEAGPAEPTPQARGREPRRRVRPATTGTRSRHRSPR